MKVLICGIDGYLGWPLALHLVGRGHEIRGIDNRSRRKWVKEVGGVSAIPILDPNQRADMYDWYPKFPEDMTNYTHISGVLETFQPDCIVHLAEQPSAAFSMRGVEHATSTQYNNVMGTLVLLYAMAEKCPNAHLLKLGTMGEYGTPEIPIPEAGPHQFPRQPGSFYHASKVHDSVNIEFACRVWGLRSTDIMQGVVYGARTPDNMDQDHNTRFDIDECFGTVINRFCSQAVVGIPLTVYGDGGQIRGFLPLRDSIQCLRIGIENPPETGEYRVFNQFEELFSIGELARLVADTANEIGIATGILPVDNPRVEKEHHTYEVDHKKLFDLGYVRTGNIRGEISEMIRDLLPYKERINRCQTIMPQTSWSMKEYQPTKL